jgi:hypothetical protein
VRSGSEGVVGLLGPSGMGWAKDVERGISVRHNNSKRASMDHSRVNRWEGDYS